MDRKRLEDISEIRAGCLFVPIAVACLPFLAIGTVMIVLSLDAVHGQARDNAVSNRIEASIISSEVVTVQTGSSNNTRYLVQTEFTYEHNGLRKTSDRFAPLPIPGSWREARDAVERYPPGSQTLAWLPDDPDELAFLEKHWDPMVYAGVGAGLFAWGFCGLLLTVCGGWRWTGKAWLGGWAILSGMLTVGGYAAWHAVSHVPIAQLPGWLIAVGVGVGVSALLPILGAWQASRVAHALREIEQ